MQQKDANMQRQIASQIKEKSFRMTIEVPFGQGRWIWTICSIPIFGACDTDNLKKKNQLQIVASHQ